MMSPQTSPNLLAKPRIQVRRVSKKAAAVAISILAFAVLLLMYAAMSRGAGSQDPRKVEAPQFRQLQAKPDTKLADAKPVQGNTGTAQVRGESPSAEKTAQKEELEFLQDIKKDRRRAYMSRLSAFDSALTAPSSIELTTATAAEEPRNRRDGASASGGNAQSESLFPQFAADGSVAAAAGRENADPNMQGRKDFFSERQKLNGYLPGGKRALLSPYEVKTGTVIPGVMISGISSDLPGQIIAQVSQNVFDTATGEYLLIPQGSRLVGSYDNFVALGQERALIAWNRIIFPDGATLELLNMPGNDTAGYAGFHDQVNNHYMRIFGNAMLLSLVGAGYQISQPQLQGQTLTNQDIIASQVGQNLNQVSGEMIRRNMQIQPTLEIRPGYKFVIMVNKDMILEPFQEAP
jgi:type IV secretion system protein VirB10